MPLLFANQFGIYLRISQIIDSNVVFFFSSLSLTTSQRSSSSYLVFSSSPSSFAFLSSSSLTWLSSFSNRLEIDLTSSSLTLPDLVLSIISNDLFNSFFGIERPTNSFSKANSSKLKEPFCSLSCSQNTLSIGISYLSKATLKVVIHSWMISFSYDFSSSSFLAP